MSGKRSAEAEALLNVALYVVCYALVWIAAPLLVFGGLAAFAVWQVAP